MKRGVKLLKNIKSIYVLNATPIIHFSKIGKLEQILELCNAYISKEVYMEVVERSETHPDSLIVKEAVESGKLKVYQIKKESDIQILLKFPEIHRGEAETIIAAKELKGFAIIDDAEARVIAKVLKVKTEPGCLFLLFRLLKFKKIDQFQAKNMLEDLIKSGLYLDVEVLLRAYKKIDQI